MLNRGKGTTNPEGSGGKDVGDDHVVPQSGKCEAESDKVRNVAVRGEQTIGNQRLRGVGTTESNGKRVKAVSHDSVTTETYDVSGIYVAHLHTLGEVLPNRQKYGHYEYWRNAMQKKD